MSAESSGRALLLELAKNQQESPKEEKLKMKKSRAARDETSSKSFRAITSNIRFDCIQTHTHLVSHLSSLHFLFFFAPSRSHHHLIPILFTTFRCLPLGKHLPGSQQMTSQN